MKAYNAWHGTVHRAHIAAKLEKTGLEGYHIAGASDIARWRQDARDYTSRLREKCAS